MKAICKRNIQTGIATEENIESVSHSEIKQQNTLSNYSLKYIIAIGVFVLIIFIFIMHWYRGNAEGPTKHDGSLDNKIANTDKLMDNASLSFLLMIETIAALSLGVMIILGCLMCSLIKLMKKKQTKLNTSELYNI